MRFVFWIFLYLDKTIVAHLKKGVNKKLTPLTIFIIGQEAKSGYPSCRKKSKKQFVAFSLSCLKCATIYNTITLFATRKKLFEILTINSNS